MLYFFHVHTEIHKGAPYFTFFLHFSGSENTSQSLQVSFNFYLTLNFSTRSTSLPLIAVLVVLSILSA